MGGGDIFANELFMLLGSSPGKRGKERGGGDVGGVIIVAW